MPNRKRTLVLVAASLGLVGGAAGLAFVVARPDQQPGTAVAPPLATERIHAIENALSSDDPAATETILAGAVREAFHQRPQRLLPPGSAVHVDVDHIVRNGDELATAPATVTGPQPGHWFVFLVREQGDWFVYAADQAG